MRPGIDHTAVMNQSSLSDGRATRISGGVVLAVGGALEALGLNHAPDLVEREAKHGGHLRQALHTPGVDASLQRGDGGLSNARLLGKRGLRKAKRLASRFEGEVLHRYTDSLRSQNAQTVNRWVRHAVP